MDRMTQFYIGGEWVAPVSGETMPVMNPANGERLSRSPLAGFITGMVSPLSLIHI